jgi:hypothetical protein
MCLENSFCSLTASVIPKFTPPLPEKKHSIKGRREEPSRHLSCTKHHLDSDDMIWAYRHTAKEWLGRLLLNIYGYGE